ncbi:MAG: FGGY family carbohydrate kinase [Nocardioidaceae bacterium]
MGGRVVAGLDLGSTGLKILLADEEGGQLLVLQRPTPWRDGPGGTTDLDAGDLARTLEHLLHTAADRLRALRPGAAVEAVAISGMGETGFLLDRDGRAVAPGFAWFDPRGRQEIDSLPSDLCAAFAGRTGLPLGAQVPVAKLLHLRRQGRDLRGLRWANLPEQVAASMGVPLVSEYSLASRTGLLDQDTGRPWTEMLEHLGVGEGFIPPLVDAGSPLGAAAAPWLPPAFAGAQVTVAGHDHLVSAVSGGLITSDRYHVSIGTAEVLLRVLDEPVPFQDRELLAGSLVNSVRHVVPGKHVVIAGVKTGLLMRRALQLAGISDRSGRDRLDEAATALPLEGALADGAVEVRGARNDDGVLSLTVRSDGVTPAEMLNAVLRHSNDEISLLVEVVDSVTSPARTTLLTGGWADMRSVQRARARVLPDVRVSARDQDTAYGAALFATRLLPTGGRPSTSTHAARPPARPTDLDPSPRRTPMNELTTLERRAMAAISTPGGSMLIVAADQRNSMKAVMTDAPDGPGSVTTDQLRAAKADLVTYLGNHAPAILLDPEVALPQVVDDATLSRDTALVVGMDASGFETVDGLRYTTFVEGVDARAVRELGGDVAKMLWYVRPDRQGPDSRVAEEMRSLVKSCEHEGLLLIVELLTYRLDDETEEDYRAAFPGLVADAAALAVGCGAKVLKLPYPGSAETSAAVTAAAAGVPWAVLSAGVDHETFVEQVRIAMANGASGAMAGRALWKDSLAVSPEVRRELLTSRALVRLRGLADVVG